MSLCVYFFSLITWDMILKKEMVKAAGFEPRFFQLWVQNVATLAIAFCYCIYIKMVAILAKWRFYSLLKCLDLPPAAICIQNPKWRFVYILILLQVKSLISNVAR
jgi:hypothetical protein